MEKIDMNKNATSFEFKREGVNYLKRLGATEIEISEVENYDNKYYLFDNMLFQPYGEYQSLYVEGIPRDLELKLEHSPVENCIYGKNILCLEALIYLHCLKNYPENEVEKHYREIIFDAKNKALFDAYIGSQRISKPKTSENLPIDLDDENRDRFLHLLQKFDDLTKPEYLFLDKENYNRFLSNNVIFHSTGAYKSNEKVDDENCIIFDYKIGNTQGHLEVENDFMETTIMDYSHANNSGKYEQIYHFFYKNDGEVLKYFGLNGYRDNFELNLRTNEYSGSINGKEFKRQATPKDYELIADALDRFVTTVELTSGLDFLSDVYNQESRHK